MIVGFPGAQAKTLMPLVQGDYPAERARFAELLRRHRAEVVFCNTAKTLAHAQLAEAAGVPALTVIRESSDEHVGLGIFKGGPLQDARAALRSGTGLVFVSDHTRRLWAQSHDRLAPTALIPNGVRLNGWAEVRQRPRTEIRAELNLYPDERVILSVGTISRRKSQLDIIDAFERLPLKVVAKSRLVLVGARPGPYLKQMKQRREALPEKVRKRVRMVNETDDVAPWYRAADMFVLASRSESYPRVVLEAMYFGLPLVVTDVFGTKEQVRDGHNGLFFQPGDVDRLTQHLETLLEDEALRERFGRAGAERFWELTTYEEMVHRYAALLHNCAAPEP